MIYLIKGCKVRKKCAKANFFAKNAAFIIGTKTFVHSVHPKYKKVFIYLTGRRIKFDFIN